MKKIIAMALMALAVVWMTGSLSPTTVSAASTETTVSIIAVTADAVAQTMTINGQIMNPVANQQVTLLVYKAGSDYEQADNICYIDQIGVILNASNQFTLTFPLDASAIAGELTIRMGGSNIQTPVIWAYSDDDTDDGDDDDDTDDDDDDDDTDDDDDDDFYTITAEAGANGTVIGGGVFASDEAVTLTARPDIGYSFGGWYENGVKIDGAATTYVFAATVDRILEARFIPIGYIQVKNQGRIQYGEEVGSVYVQPSQAFLAKGGAIQCEWWWTSYDTGAFGYLGSSGSSLTMPAPAFGVLSEQGMYRVDAKITNVLDGSDEPDTVSRNIWVVSTPQIIEMSAEAVTVAAGQPVKLHATVATQDNATMFYWWHRMDVDTGNFTRLGGANGWLDSNVYTDNEILAPGTYRYELLVFSVRFMFTDVPEAEGSIIGNGSPYSGVADGSLAYSDDGSFYYGGTWSTATGYAITVTVE